MTYNIRKTNLSDFEYLSVVEFSASNVFRTLQDLAWIADDNGMSLVEHKRYLEEGFSWVAVDSLSQDIVGFLTAEIVEGDYYVGEVSVSDGHQQKGIGSALFGVALKQAQSLGLDAATLTTFIDVPWNAPYYEKLGFVILTSDTLPPYLQRILRAEEIAGLPIDRRCAMRKMFTSV